MAGRVDLWPRLAEHGQMSRAHTPVWEDGKQRAELPGDAGARRRRREEDGDVSGWSGRQRDEKAIGEAGNATTELRIALEIRRGEPKLVGTLKILLWDSSGAGQKQWELLVSLENLEFAGVVGHARLKSQRVGVASAGLLSTSVCGALSLATTSVEAEAPGSNWDYEGPCQDGVEQHKEAVKSVAIVLEEPPAREAQPTVIKGMDAVKTI
ncbi:hypothetical protein NL676_008270 [Syzygium grande]|nr:hypothetical protein NL676_008270 [Syzygium grande]